MSIIIIIRPHYEKMFNSNAFKKFEYKGIAFFFGFKTAQHFPIHTNAYPKIS